MKYEVVIYAGEHNRFMCPVTITLPYKNKYKDFRGVILSSKEGEQLAQVEREKERIHITFIIEKMKRGEKKEFKLKFLKDVSEEIGMRLERYDEQIGISYKGNGLARYNFSRELSKPYIYPLIGPTGACVTDDGPKDHVHHRSLWVAHGDVNGVDVWAEKENSGRIIHNEFLKLTAGPIYAEIIAKNVWVDNEGKPLLDEVRRVRFWKPTNIGWYLDHETLLKATYGDVILGDTKEAGMVSVRMREALTVRRGGRIVNSFGGINEKETWGKRAHWCDYYGTLEGEIVGIAIFDSQENPRHPTYWHVRDYGLMTANIFGLTQFHKIKGRRGNLKLAKGSIVKFTYRLFIHRGSTDEADVRGRYLDFIYPPEVRVKAR